MDEHAIRIDDALLTDAARAIPVFFRIADAWSLSTAESAHLLGVSQSEVCTLREARPSVVDKAIVTRLSYVFTIYACLAVLLPVSKRAHGWLRHKNRAPLLSGVSAMEFLMGGGIERLAALAAYLAAERAGS